MKKSIITYFIITMLFLSSCKVCEVNFGSDSTIREEKNKTSCKCKEILTSNVFFSDDIHVIEILEKYFNDKSTAIIYCPIVYYKETKIGIYQFYQISTNRYTDIFFLFDEKGVEILKRDIDKQSRVSEFLKENNFPNKKIKKGLKTIEKTITYNENKPSNSF